MGKLFGRAGKKRNAILPMQRGNVHIFACNCLKQMMKTENPLYHRAGGCPVLDYRPLCTGSG
jgi:hypothetical protein